MKKSFCLFMSLVIIMSLCACGSKQDVIEEKQTETATQAVTEVPKEEGEIPDPVQYEWTVGENEEQCAKNMIFEKEVIVSGDYGQMAFENCTFKADVINTSKAGTRVVIVDGCKFENGAKVIFKNDVMEATMEDNFPKIFLYMPAEVSWENGCAGTCMGLGKFDFVGDGVTYKLSECDMFMDEAKPEAGVVPFEGQENANAHGVAQWNEGGERTIFTIAEHIPEFD